jgi:hypothetical protein
MALTHLNYHQNKLYQQGYALPVVMVLLALFTSMLTGLLSGRQLAAVQDAIDLEQTVVDDYARMSLEAMLDSGGGVLPANPLKPGMNSNFLNYSGFLPEELWTRVTDFNDSDLLKCAKSASFLDVVKGAEPTIYIAINKQTLGVYQLRYFMIPEFSTYGDPQNPISIQRLVSCVWSTKQQAIATFSATLDYSCRTLVGNENDSRCKRVFTIERSHKS